MIKNSWQEAGLPEPIFENLAACFKITLFKSPPITEADPVYWKQLSKFKLNHRQFKAMIWLKNNPNQSITNSDYRQINHLGENDVLARQDLKQLLALKLIFSTDRNRYSEHFLNVKTLNSHSKGNTDY